MVVTISSPSRLLRNGSMATPEYYRVQPGDTLSQIAKLHGSSVEQLAKNNQLISPDRLYPGQLIKLGAPDSSSTRTQVVFQTNDSRAKKNQEQRCKLPDKRLSLAQTQVKQNPAVNSPALPSTPSQAVSCKVPQWHWPTQGKIIEQFSQTDGGNRGIDLAGDRGQAIYSSAEGRVVYAGNALHGYGHLLIIKHNEEWLSAYAHNDALLVREQQAIKAGQKIATMGSSGAHSVRLHFEIRYKGKSVNPLHYLPQR
jgi:lipoprotein NlpD